MFKTPIFGGSVDLAVKQRVLTFLAWGEYCLECENLNGKECNNGCFDFLSCGYGHGRNG